MPPRVRVTTNNDIAYIWWSVPKKIPGALGFSVHRELKDGTEKPLPAWVGFDRATSPQKQSTTDKWPIQSFQWKDVFAPRKGKFRYKIFVVKGTAAHAVPDNAPILTTDWAELEEQFGPVRAVFNRGLLSTQAMNRGSNAPAKNSAILRKAIATKDDKVRMRLTQELLPTIYDLLRRIGSAGGKCFAALYELTDAELIAELTGAKTTQLVLSNANSSKRVNKKTVAVYDGTNMAVRKQLHKAKYGITDRMLKGSSIGHNKFIVYHDATGPSAVLTGSTNWTPTGLCGQTNNAVLIEDRKVAKHYQDYWKLIQAEKKTLQAPELRKWTRTHPIEVPLGQKAKLKVWFSPNTERKTKSEKEMPVDVKEVFGLIDGAKSAVLFLLFNPGKPSILERINEAEQKSAKKGTPLYVRGAISDAKTASEGSVRVFSRSATKADKVITGVAGVPDDFGYWEKELLKLGHAAIHDKVLVIDPFSKDCVVITGSHNLGYKASFANDENMVMIRGHRPIAEAFATHVLDVVNHYKWRYKLQELNDEGKLKDAWQDLDENDKWQDKYFDSGFLASRDAFVLAEAT
jgi:phosphatidylserine/phosphatidylglycerophosphate/cardiolipin synthase-like enzyme